MLTVITTCTWQGRIEFYAGAGLHNVLAFSGQYSFQHRQETVASRRNRPHPVHQALEEASVFVVIAIADAYSPRMPPDLGRQEQEPQTRRRQRRVPHRPDVSTFFTIEQ